MHFPDSFWSKWKRIQKMLVKYQTFYVQYVFIEIVNASIVKSIIRMTDVAHHSVDLGFWQRKIIYKRQTILCKLSPELYFSLHRPSTYFSEPASWTHLSNSRPSLARSSFAFHYRIFWHTTILQHCPTDPLILGYIYPTVGAPSYVLEELDQISVFKKSSITI